jgi:hypothetical protein
MYDTWLSWLLNSDREALGDLHSDVVPRAQIGKVYLIPDLDRFGSVVGQMESNLLVRGIHGSDLHGDLLRIHEHAARLRTHRSEHHAGCCRPAGWFATADVYHHFLGYYGLDLVADLDLAEVDGLKHITPL